MLVCWRNSVCGFHKVLAGAMSHFTGWTAMPGGAIWWLVILGLPLAWIGFRTLVDVESLDWPCRFSRPHLQLYRCGGREPWRDIGRGTESWIYNRRRDVTRRSLARVCRRGILCSVRRARCTGTGCRSAADNRQTQNAKVAASSKADNAQAKAGRKPLNTLCHRRLPAANSSSRNRRNHRLRPANGSTEPSRARPYEDGDDESDDDRKLSKSERKRLRKIKMQNCAA